MSHRARLTSRAERRVSLDEDALLVAVLFELMLRVVGVVLDLVDGRDDFPGFGEMLEDGDTSVGDTDRSGFARGKDILHLLPSLSLVPVPVDVSRSVLLDGEELGRAVLDGPADLSVPSLLGAKSAKGWTSWVKQE
jgi:hypothetical protein